MKNSSTKEKEAEKNEKGLEDRLEQGLMKLQAPKDMEQLAEETKALIRRRGVHGAMDLLRMVMGYCVLGYSFRMLGAWCVLRGIGYMSKTAVRKRLQKCEQWLGKLIIIALQQQQVMMPKSKIAAKPVIVDASVVCQPGSKGSDWRVHLRFDLLNSCIDQVTVTDGHGAEGLPRFQFGPGDICLADRAYATAKSLGWILAQKAWLVIRSGWNRLALETEDGRRFEVVEWLRSIHLAPLGEPAEVGVSVKTPQGRFPLRLVAQAISAEAAEKARRKVRQDAQKNHHTPDERSLFAAGFVILLTNLPSLDWSMATVLQLYRFRWQVEITFKRLKSIMFLDALRCKDAQLAQVFLLGKLLAALAIQRIQLALNANFNDAFHSSARPLNLFSLQTYLWEQLKTTVRGLISLAAIFAQFDRLLRYFADEPRKRKRQSVQADLIFRRFVPC